jgi:hypothetical protein
VAGLVVDWFAWRRPLAAAIHQGVYFRATGPIRIITGRRAGTVFVGDVVVKYVSLDICSALRDLPWGTIDYAPRARMVIEQRDADGELLYRYPGYRPDANRFDRLPMPSVLMGFLCGVGVTTLFMLAMFALVVVMAP